jgi:large subunit ribosomal protein L10
MARPEKVAAVDEIKDRLSAADATLLTEYRGLTVTELAALRAALRDSGTQYKVFKNTLARRAAEAADLSDILDLLEGPTAFAFVSGDVAGAAKALRDFARTNDKLVVKGGLLNGAILTADQIDELAKLPSRDELLARIAGGFKAPLQKAAGLFSGLQRKTAYALQALIDKRVEAGEAPPPTDEPPTDEPPPDEPPPDEPPTDEPPTDEPPPDDAEAPEASGDEADTPEADTPEEDPPAADTPEEAPSDDTQPASEETDQT